MAATSEIGKPMQLSVVVVGATGLLGRELMKAFAGYEKVIGTGLTRANEETAAKDNIYRVDVTNKEELRAFLTEHDPEVIVYAAAEKRCDACEQDEERARAINVEGVRVAAECAYASRDCFLIYISTDYVFDGENPPYKPSSPTNPLNAYGRLKKEGEQAIWDSKHHGGVLRVPLLYGEVEHLSESSVTAMVNELQPGVPAQEKRKHVVDNCNIRYPTHAADVALAVRKLSDRRSRHCALQGTWHFSGPQPLTKYEMLLKMGSEMGESTAHIAPREGAEEGAGVARPRNAKLDVTALKLMSILGKPRSFDDGFPTVVESIRKLL
eukprot:TRINITY_DN8296_c0_g1_i1.p1 TRINITY_DN8296_c0_g1~~TRINITY_DN8296_c0_g1_i1.p1  ORF type:complete len:339 (+),score=112.28 TRINITY_DN8296_c0_g1_i1:46-1017(+)